MNVHSEGSAGLLRHSAVVAFMNESREMNLSMPAHPGLVLVTEATLQAAVSEIGQTKWKTCKQRHSFLRGSCSSTPEIVSKKSGKYQLNILLHCKQSSPIQNKTFPFVKECLLNQSSQVQVSLCRLFMVGFNVSSQCFRIFGYFATVAAALLNR